MNKLVTPLFCLTLSILNLNCSTIKHEPINCIDSKSEKTSLDGFIKILDGISKQNNKKSTNLVLLENTCYKKKYVKDGYNIILYKRSDSPPEKVLGTLREIDGKNTASKQCFDNAIKILSKLNVSFIDLIISESKKRDNFWNDLEVGPASWLSCADESSSDFYKSISTLLHELTHDLKKENCHFLINKGNTNCFNFDSKLPSRSLAKMDNYFTKNETGISVINYYQDLYLINNDIEPFYLFDELNAYVVGTRTEILFIKNRSQYDFNPLSLIAYFSIRYIDELRKKDFALFQQNFVESKLNRQSIIQLFNETEFAFLTWQTAMNENNLRIHDLTKTLFSEYQKLRHELKLF